MPSRLLVVWLALAALCGGATCGTVPITELPPAENDLRELLGPGDIVEVRVFGEPELSGTHEISPTGTIRLPLVGPIAAIDIGPDALAQRIEAAYNERYLKSAEVSLMVKESRSRKVFVLGQVAKPGPVAIDGKMTVIEAIALAGGTTKLADANRTLLTRDNKDGEHVRVTVPVGAIGQGQAADVELQPGDILFVPESPF